MSTRKPLQDISNQIHSLNLSSIKDNSMGKKSVSTLNNKKLTLPSPLMPNINEEELEGFINGQTLSFFESDIEDNDLKEFYDEFTKDIKTKASKELEMEKEKLSKLNLESERNRKQIDELTSENKTLTQTIEQLKTKLSNVLNNSKAEGDLKNQVKVLNEKLVKLESRVESEVQQKEKLQSLLKVKETTNLRLRERNDRLMKSMNGEEKSSKKYTDQIKLKDERIERITKEMEREKKIRLDCEAKQSEMESTIEGLKQKITSAEEEIETSSRLIEVLDTKLKISNDRNKDLEEKLKRGEEKREEESSELLSLREEMSNLCEIVLQEKQQSEKLQSELYHLKEFKQKLENDVNKFSSQLEEREEENRELKETVSKLEEQLETLSKDSKDTEQELNDKVSDLEKALSEREKELEDVKEKEAHLCEQMESIKVLMEKSRAKIVKGKTKIKDMERRLETELEKTEHLSEKNTSLMRKLETVTREKYSMIEEFTQKEEMFSKIKDYTTDLESRLAKKESEYERLSQKFNLCQEELQKEKAKSERSWKELEETVKIMKQSESEKESLEKVFKHEQEVLEMKMNNKITMLEKKCEFLRKLSEIKQSNVETVGDEQLQELKEYTNKLLCDIEHANETCHQLELRVSEKDSQYMLVNEKVRQLEDLLHCQHQQLNMPLKQNDLKKRLLTLEQSVDEVLLELSIEGITISKLAPREKAVLILEKYNEVKSELSRVTEEREQAIQESYRNSKSRAQAIDDLVKLKESMTKEVFEVKIECIKDLEESCEVLQQKLNSYIEEREFAKESNVENENHTSVNDLILDDLLNKSLSIQVNLKKVNVFLGQVESLKEVIESNVVFSEDYIMKCSELEKQVMLLEEERDTLLKQHLEQSKTVHLANKKKIDKLIKKTISIQTDFEIAPLPAIEKLVQCPPEHEELELKLQEQIEEYQNLKNKYHKLLFTCHKYKKLMMKFTQLHNKENKGIENVRIEDVDAESASETIDLLSVPTVQATLQTTPFTSPKPMTNNSGYTQSPTQSITSVSTTLSSGSERSTTSVRRRKSGSYLNSHIFRKSNK
ncbi:hypothetical protein ABK040_002385 [Willaertia magna]